MFFEAPACLGSLIKYCLSVHWMFDCRVCYGFKGGFVSVHAWVCVCVHCLWYCLEPGFGVFICFILGELITVYLIDFVIYLTSKCIPVCSWVVWSRGYGYSNGGHSLNVSGRWSDAVVGPRVIVWLWCVCWLASIMSGVVCELWLMCVAKFGLRWISLFALMSISVPFPAVLEVRLLRQGCLALRSPSIYVFRFRVWCKAVKISYGKKGSAWR